MKERTRAAHAGKRPHEQHGAVNPPVYRASTVLFSSLKAMEQARADYEEGAKRVVYARRGTPTVFAFEEALAALEEADEAYAVPSGLMAITASLMSFLQAGDHLLMTDSAYMPARRFAEIYLRRFGVTVDFYDPLLGGAIADLITPKTRVVYTESPGTHSFDIQDIPAIAQAAHAAGAVVLMDNSWATPLYFKPFAHGVDVAIHSASKYIGGHADLVLGAITTRREFRLRIRDTVTSLGCNVGPDDVYLALRGLRTLPVRLAQHQRQGLALAEWLAGRPEVARILHPALRDDPGHKLWRRDFTGASGLFGFVLRPVPKRAIDAMLSELRLFGIGVSWGGFESQLIPTYPEKSRSATVWQAEGPVMRIHAGLEDLDDLKADLEAAFVRLNAARS